MTISSRKQRLVWVALLAAWFLCPLPNPSALRVVEAQRQGTPGSVVRDEPFVCSRDSAEIRLDASWQLIAGQVEMDVFDADGKRLAGPFMLAGDKNDTWTFVTNGGFPRGRAYRLQCTEHEVTGGYHISILQPWSITFMHRLLAGLTVLAAGLAVTAVLGFCGIGGDGLRRLSRRAALMLFLSSFIFVYSAVHEGGHVLALMAFGVCDLSRTRFLPIGGAPHAAAKASAHLAPWQGSIVAIAGPLLPTLLGYLSFAVWVSPFGRRWREQNPLADLGWSALTVFLVFAQAVISPVFLPGMLRDSDYLYFIQNVPLPPWIANVALAAISLVSLTIIVWVVKHCVSRVRALRAARREQLAERVPFLHS